MRQQVPPKIYKFSRKPTKCPVCNSTKIARYLYGEPNYLAIQKELDEGVIEIGGCCISDDSPKWKCKSCETDLYSTKPLF